MLRQMPVVLFRAFEIRDVNPGRVKEQDLAIIVHDRVKREIDQPLGAVCPRVSEDFAIWNSLRHSWGGIPNLVARFRTVAPPTCIPKKPTQLVLGAIATGFEGHLIGFNENTIVAHDPGEHTSLLEHSLEFCSGGDGFGRDLPFPLLGLLALSYIESQSVEAFRPAICIVGGPSARANPLVPAVESDGSIFNIVRCTTRNALLNRPSGSFPVLGV